MGLFKPLYYFPLSILICINFKNTLQDENFGTCADPECSAPISEAKAHAMYSPPDSISLRVIPGELVKIYVKGYGPKKNLYGIEKQDGSRGYIPMAVITETRILNKPSASAKRPFIEIRNNEASDAKTKTDSTAVVLESETISSIQMSSVSSQTKAQSQSTQTPKPNILEKNPEQQMPSSPSTEIKASSAAPFQSSESNSYNVDQQILSSSESQNLEVLTQEALNPQTEQSEESVKPVINISRVIETTVKLYDSKLTEQLHSTLNSLSEHHKRQAEQLLASIPPQPSGVSDESLNSRTESHRNQAEHLSSSIPSPQPSKVSETNSATEQDFGVTMRMLYERCMENDGKNCNEYLESTPLPNSPSVVSDTESTTTSPFPSSTYAAPPENIVSDYSSPSTTIATSTQSSYIDSTIDHNILDESHPSDLPDSHSTSDSSSSIDENENNVPDGESDNEDYEDDTDDSDPSSEGEENQELHEDTESHDKLKREVPPNNDPILDLVSKGIKNTVERTIKTRDSSAANLEPSKESTNDAKIGISDSDPNIGKEHAEHAVSGSVEHNNAENIVPLSTSFTQHSQMTHEEEAKSSISSSFIENADTSPVNTNINVTSKTYDIHSQNPSPSLDTSVSPDPYFQPLTSDDDLSFDVDEGTAETLSEPPPGRHILGDGSEEDYTESSSITVPDTAAESDSPESVREESVIETSYFSVETIEWMIELCAEIFANFVHGLREFLELVISWAPEPVYSWLLNLNSCGVSARAVVFSVLSIFPSFFLFVSITYIQRHSKENNITAELCAAEQKLYHTRAERNVLAEENNNLWEKVKDMEKCLTEDQSLTTEMLEKVRHLESEYQQAKSEIKSNEETILALSDENEELKTKLAEVYDKCQDLSECLRKEENETRSLSEVNEKMQDEMDQLVTEKQQLSSAQESYKEKISSLEQSCKQLLQEAEIWNARVTELTEQMYNEAAAKKEAEELIESKNAEIETLKTVVSSVEVLKSAKDLGDGDKKTLEDAMQSLMDVGKIQVQLKKSEEMAESLSEKLKQERNKILEMEVELLESKSEVEKLKAHYNQALQDKAEAQTKLDVLTKYFKDKELQLQKELGVQEAVRQRKEEDATHAERRIHLIEEENSSYKFQVATLKQEIEETERNLKNQIATQEKKAHENWLAARAAERKVEEMKQENTQFRQRLTLLEREQEKWSSSSQNDIIRPVPQRASEQGPDGLSSGEGGIPIEFLPRHIPPPPLRHPDDLLPPLPHLPLIPPHGRPLLPPPPSHSPRLPPPLMPPFLPPSPYDPVLSGMPPHRPVPWSTMSEKRFESERRKMSSEFDSPSSRRNQTPPRSDSSRRSVSPTDFNSRSRSSSPPVPLPDFHNTPPHLGRPGLPPPPGVHMRYHGGPPPPPPHLMHRRDFNPNASPYRDDNRSERFADDASSSSGGRNRNQSRQASEEV